MRNDICHKQTSKWKGYVNLTACLPICIPQNPYLPNLVFSAGSEDVCHFCHISATLLELGHETMACAVCLAIISLTDDPCWHWNLDDAGGTSYLVWSPPSLSTTATIVFVCVAGKASGWLTVAFSKLKPMNHHCYTAILRVNGYLGNSSLWTQLCAHLRQCATRYYTQKYGFS